MADSEVTLGELARGLNALENRINVQFDSVNRRLDNLQFVPRREYEIQIAAMLERVEILEEAKRWTTRALVTALLYPIIVAAITFAALAAVR